MAKSEGIKVISENRKARHDYHIEETFEAGIVLTGTEVKSLRLGRANLKDSYAGVETGEVFLYNCHISTYDQGNRFNHEPKRKRKLLLHKREINRLIGQTKQKGYTLVPLRLYFSRGLVKVELALAKGKRSFDKREDIAKRDAQRQIARALKEKQQA
ncbi:MAG: SsrA-binding protein SmpB [Limnochordia bacterium]|nr:SsrA-binding protein SmpB [Limnochordia bacterium]